MEICSHEFSPESVILGRRVRDYIDKKIAESNPAYLNSTGVS